MHVSPSASWNPPGTEQTDSIRPGSCPMTSSSPDLADQLALLHFTDLPLPLIVDCEGCDQTVLKTWSSPALGNGAGEERKQRQRASLTLRQGATTVAPTVRNFAFPNESWGLNGMASCTPCSLEGMMRIGDVVDGIRMLMAGGLRKGICGVCEEVLRRTEHVSHKKEEWDDDADDARFLD